MAIINKYTNSGTVELAKWIIDNLCLIVLKITMSGIIKKFSNSLLYFPILNSIIMYEADVLL